MVDTIRTGFASLPASTVTVEGTGRDDPGAVVGKTLVSPSGVTPEQADLLAGATPAAVPSTICSRGPAAECAFATVTCEAVYSESGDAYVSFASNGEIVFRGQPRDGYGAREISGYTFLLGDLVPSAGYKGGYIVGKDLDGNLLFDWQLFGAGTPTGFLYWREAYSTIGWRVQMLSSTAGEGFVMESFNGADLQFDLSNSGAGAHFYVGAVGGFVIDVNGDRTLGFFGSAPIGKPTITGSKGGNVALANLLTELARYGLITDSTT